MSLSETSKRMLRHQVLEIRSEYRSQRERWLGVRREEERLRAQCQQLRDHIRTIQLDCNDPIEIDPQESPGDFPHTDESDPRSCSQCGPHPHESSDEHTQRHHTVAGLLGESGKSR